MARVALRTLGFSHVRSALERTRIGQIRAPEFPFAVRRAVERAARTVPGSACLDRSLVAYRLLRAGGHAAELTIGVERAPAAGNPLLAHAWVRSGDLLVTGDAADADLSRFTALAHIRSGA